MAEKRTRRDLPFDGRGTGRRHGSWLRRAFDFLTDLGTAPIIRLPRPIRKGFDAVADAGGMVRLRPPRFARRAANFLLGLHPLMLALLGVSVAGAVGGGAYYFGVYRPQQVRNQAISAGWKAFTEAYQNGDDEGLRRALDSVIEAGRPNPPQLAVDRRKALDTSEAKPTDELMLPVTMRAALRGDDLAAADREAEKLLAKKPKDWLALCVRAHAALKRGDQAAADRFLDALPNPSDPDANIHPSGVLFALVLYRATGRDTDQLLSFVRARLLPAMKLDVVQKMPASAKIQFLECFLEGFEPSPDKRQPAGLSTYWAAAGGLFDRSADELIAGEKTADLIRLGRVGNRLTAALTTLRKDSQVTEEQFPPLRAEMTDRCKRVWEAVIAGDPKNAEAYQSLAISRFQAGDYLGARESVIRGLTACGDDPPLAALLATMLQAEDRPEVAAATLWQAAEKNPDKPVWWVLAAEAAAAANRRDLALAACQRGLAAEPDNPWLTRLEGRLWMDAGDPNRAAQAIARLGKPALTGEPPIARTYARAIVESGLEVLAEEYLAEVDRASRERDNPNASAAALQGLLDAKTAPDPARMAEVAERADRLLARWRDHPELLQVRALALAREAEFAAPPWELARTQRAATALERALAKTSDDYASAAALAWLRLKGQRNPIQALADVAPIARAEPVRPLPVDQLEVLGAVLLAADKPDEAARVLERTRKAIPTARGMILLARAYVAAGRRDNARTALQAAANLPRSDRDQTDYLEVARALD